MATSIVDIIEGLNEKAALKQLIYRNTKNVFGELKNCSSKVVHRVLPEVVKKDKTVEVELKEISEFEFHLKFSGDTIAFIMHTNVFVFPPEHEVNHLKYVKEQPERAFCGMIQVYNFLSDSIKYNRLADTGYLLARIFINAEDHFYIDGHRQLDFLFKEMGSRELDQEVIHKIVEQSMLYVLDFDLYVPPISLMSEITLEQKDYFNNATGMATGKRLGFKMNGDQ